MVGMHIGSLWARAGGLACVLAACELPSGEPYTGGNTGITSSQSPGSFTATHMPSAEWSAALAAIEASQSAAGRGGSSDAPPCEPLDGTYELFYEPKSGNCSGELDLVDFTEYPRFKAGKSFPSDLGSLYSCQSSDDYMDEACRFHRRAQCDVARYDKARPQQPKGAVGTAQLIGELRVGRGNQLVAGELSVTIVTYENVAKCSGAYFVHGQKQ